MPEQVDRADAAGSASTAQTGIQRLPINTLYQLVSMRQSGDAQLDSGAHIAADTRPVPLLADRADRCRVHQRDDHEFYDARAGGWATDMLAGAGFACRHLAAGMSRPAPSWATLLPEVRAKSDCAEACR